MLIVNLDDQGGGAARAAFRLHAALLEHGLDSHMLVQNRRVEADTIIAPNGSLAKLRALTSAIVDELPLRSYPKRTKTTFSPAQAPSGTPSDRINALKPDIVHLHWINGGMLRIEDIAKIKAPVVWSMHDMWAFTGGCHYDEHCGRYREACGQCPVLDSSRPADLSRRVLQRKLRAFDRKRRMVMVGLSRWMTKAAAESSIFRDRAVVHLPNPIDTSTFSPLDQGRARKLLGLPVDRTLLLYGAMNATGDPRKGYSELSRALAYLVDVAVELVVFGAERPAQVEPHAQPTHYLGRIDDDARLRLLYAAADVMVVPSRQENLSNAIMESLACGTPVVAFNIGGNSDLVDHQVSGYLARDGDPADLAHGIRWILGHQDPTSLSSHAVGAVRERFDSKLVARKYADLYRDILDQ